MARAKLIEPVQRKGLAEEIADRLRTRIFDGTLRPGEKLPPERELARQLRVNRSSLREGLRLLQQLGLVSIRQGDGTRVLDFVSSASVEIIKYLMSDESLDRRKLLSDILEVRTIICGEIVRLATANITAEQLGQLDRQIEAAPVGDGDAAEAISRDFEFYESLSRVAGNIILTLMLNTVKPPFKLLRPMFSGLVITSQDVAESQRRILDAMRARDAAAAAAVAKTYLAGSAGYFLGQLETQPGQDGGRHV